ncbi:hypothetical protein E2C01_092800 [Portunus trituberculatus]|uniref:Uncharacterized protein n=1 Tax=Portunus trituberculatus TaxID=210409 RepID=A0A5B7JN21_PORTR|nr:hypothetical protein [Portunus trituberculatus]
MREKVVMVDGICKVEQHKQHHIVFSVKVAVVVVVVVVVVVPSPLPLSPFRPLLPSLPPLRATQAIHFLNKRSIVHTFDTTARQIEVF